MACGVLFVLYVVCMYLKLRAGPVVGRGGVGCPLIIRRMVRSTVGPSLDRLGGVEPGGERENAYARGEG